MSYEPAQRTTRGLLTDWAAIMRTLRDRDLIRTNNNPIGDLAEAIVHEHFGGERGEFSQGGWDAIGEDGKRLEVKAMRKTPGSKRRNLSPIRDSDHER